MLPKTFLLSAFLVSGMTLVSQQREEDAVAWFSLAVKQKITKRFSYRLMGRVRDGENFTRVNSWYLDGGLYYHPHQNVSVSANYVYAPSRMKDQQFRAFQQYYVSLNTKFNLDAYWYVSNRVIVQHTSGFFPADEAYSPYSRSDVREKLLLNRRLTRADRLYLGDEVMTTLWTGDAGLRRNRFYTGINHRFTPQLSIDVFFVLQSTYLRRINTDQFIYGLTLTYKFRKMTGDD